ncbi:MAG: flagellar hook-length control protein FliK, partial [Alsobacter sp.]
DRTSARADRQSEDTEKKADDPAPADTAAAAPVEAPVPPAAPASGSDPAATPLPPPVPAALATDEQATPESVVAPAPAPAGTDVSVTMTPASAITAAQAPAAAEVAAPAVTASLRQLAAASPAAGRRMSGQAAAAASPQAVSPGTTGAGDTAAAETATPGDATTAEAVPGATVAMPPDRTAALFGAAFRPDAAGPQAAAETAAGQAGQVAGPADATLPAPHPAPTAPSPAAPAVPVEITVRAAGAGRDAGAGQDAGGGSRIEMSVLAADVASVATPSTSALPAPQQAAQLDRTTGPAAATDARAAAQQPPVPLSALPIEIGMRALDGARRFDIRLSPEDLGRVDVRLDIAEDGTVNAQLVVDRVETLALLQRDAKTLERAFEQAGLRTQEGGVAFSLDTSGEGRRQARQERDETPAREPAPPEQARTAAGVAAALRAFQSGRTGLDIRI